MGARFRAALIHMGISVIVLLAVLALVVWIWFPDPYLRIQAPIRILGTLVAVQVLGAPLLTFAVFKPGKKGLKFDLWVIGCLQLAALAWGSWTLYLERPYFMVFALDRFNVLTEKDVYPAPIGRLEHPSKPPRGPLMILATMPADPREREQLMMETVFEGKPDLERRPRYWSLYSDNFSQVILAATPLEQLRTARPADHESIDRFAERHGRTIDELVFAPVMGKLRDYAIVLDSRTGVMLGALPVDPWLYDAE